MVDLNSVNVKNEWTDVSQYTLYCLLWRSTRHWLTNALKAIISVPQHEGGRETEQRTPIYSYLRTYLKMCFTTGCPRCYTLKPSICLCPLGAASVIHLDSAAQSEALHGYQGQPAWRLQPTERWVFWPKYLLHPVLVGKNTLQLPYIILWPLTWE